MLQTLEIAIFIFLTLWVFPFSLVFVSGYHNLKNKAITPLRFLYSTLQVRVVIEAIYKKMSKRKNKHIRQETYVEIFEQPYKEKYIWWES